MVNAWRTLCRPLLVAAGLLLLDLPAMLSMQSSRNCHGRMAGSLQSSTALLRLWMWLTMKRSIIPASGAWSKEVQRLWMRRRRCGCGTCRVVECVLIADCAHPGCTLHLVSWCVKEVPVTLS